ncbi:MAG: hypothetical protein WCG87_08460 [Bacteroidota bacterium]
MNPLSKLFTIILLLCTLSVSSKPNGYIITSKGDTILCKIVTNQINSIINSHADPLDLTIQKGVLVKDNNDNKVNYEPNQLRGFAFTTNSRDTLFYESIYVPNIGIQFVNKLEKGNVNIYRYCFSNIVCGQNTPTWQYGYFIKKEDTANLVCFQKTCDMYCDIPTICNYLGIEHTVSKDIIDISKPSNNIYLHQVLNVVHQYNNPPIIIKRPKTCDTCRCNVILIKEKGTTFIRRGDMMATYDPSGFYMYEGIIYLLKFSNHPPMNCVILKIHNDSVTLRVTNSSSKEVRNNEVYTFPIYSLEKIYHTVNGTLGSSYKMNKYTVESKTSIACPPIEFIRMVAGRLRRVHYYFCGEYLYSVYEDDGKTYWVEH